MTLPVTDVYVQLESNGERALFTDGYHRQTARYAELLENELRLRGFDFNAKQELTPCGQSLQQKRST